MSSPTIPAASLPWWLFGVFSVVVVYALFVLVLILMGRRTQARALAGFIPDCLVLFRRMLSDPRVPRSRKVLIGLLIGYLALPFDLIPDFIPIAGQLDDLIIVALVLRAVTRSAGPALVREHWPGPPDSLNLILRLAYGEQPPELPEVERVG